MSNIQNRIIQQDVDPFTMVPNEIIMEPDLSNNAKIVWTYLRMRPHDWTFYNCEILKHIKISSKTLVKTFKELEEFGLIIRTQLRGSNGQFTACNFQIFRTINRQTLDNTESPPVTQKRLSVKPITVNSPLQRKKETKKERTNISSLKDQIKKEVKRREDFEKLDKGFKVDEFYQWLQDQGDNLKTTWKVALSAWLKRPENYNKQEIIKHECAEKRSALALANKIAVIKGSFEFSNPEVTGFNISEIDFRSLKFDRGAYFYHYNDNFPIEKYKSFFKDLKINLKKS
jgi:hypothetical protein